MTTRKIEHRGRELPWLHIVRFHREIACRAEESFFSLHGDEQAERWSSLVEFDPENLAGPWELATEQVRSQSFRLAVEQGQHESMFIGGPCYLAWENDNGKWYARWRPILYREVELKRLEDGFEIVPRQAHWQLSPLIYALLDRLSARPDDLDTLADDISEKAALLVKAGHAGQAEAVSRALLGMVPELEEELRREIREDAFRVMPTPWVLFAPANRFSALTRYLIRDYERLEAILTQDESRTGGLKLLEDRVAADPDDTGEAIPLVPLNESQEAAVNAALGNRPLTVISGPPGCGKSQVVVSLLLNCWAEGTTALFASNNNKAVDVVRERLERFESEFPVAVRAGARKYNNVVEVLRRTLNMAAAASRREERTDPAEFRQRRQQLRTKRKTLEEVLASKEPQRIDETLRAALTAYSRHHERLNEADVRRTALLNALEELDLDGTDPAKVLKQVAAAKSWLARLDRCQSEAEVAAARARAIRAELPILKQSVHASLARTGWSGEEDAQALWLLSGPAPESIRTWERKAREVFEQAVEQDLQPLPWSEEFEQWPGEKEAEAWSIAARELTVRIREVCSELAPVIERIEVLRREQGDAGRAAAALGIPAKPDVQRPALTAWSALWAEVCSLERSRLDFLPWSRRRKLERRLRQAEGVLRQGLPVGIWSRIGPLTDDGRRQLAETVEACREWLDAQTRWLDAQPERDMVESRLEGLRTAAGRLGAAGVPTTADVGAWEATGAAVESRARLATLAAAAWKKRRAREAAQTALRQLAAGWSAVAGGSPVKEAWRAAGGKEFDREIRALGEQQDPQRLSAARKVFFGTNLATLTEPWEAAVQAQSQIGELTRELERMPTVATRVAAWVSERPAGEVLGNWDRPVWPSGEVVEGWNRRIADVEGWCGRWRRFMTEEQPALLADAGKELEWATGSLRQAAALLPQLQEYDKVRRLVEQSTAARDRWPTGKITEAFREFSPERIRAKIEGIDAELERGSFDDAKAAWLERLATDTAAVQAVDSLEKALNRQRGEVRESQIGTFREALKLVPIWITTAQAPQAIPLEPELFDLVVIDEASQCTVTNLLPLMFRAKRLVILGDEHQLPAIPNIQKTEEEVLARKFGVEEHLQTIGHATVNVYGAAADALPRRRGDVAMLIEHFRSHPQIIGFSNREIYSQQLLIRKGPETARPLPFGSGVHRVPVRGQAVRGERGRSWFNQEEGKAVLAKIQEIRAQAAGLSIGVVTPFAAQKEWLREQVQQMGLASDILVDTAYGFQGDERDVIIFSAVVARGITASACRWVESPPNLVNVALTRAREALFVVADFDYCMQQEGILKKLAGYCRDVQLLRETSPAELELYSWMVVEGLTPAIHPRIGDHEADFELRASNAVRIALEVDGETHHKERESRDRAIDAYLEGRGYKVVRIPARVVLETPHEAMHRIRDALRA